MMKDNFFEAIDQKLEVLNQDQKSQREKAEQLEATVQRFIQETIPHLEEYKKNLEQRGISVIFRHSSSSITFYLYYADGGYHGFRLSEHNQYHRFKILGVFTGENGGEFISEGSEFLEGHIWTWYGFQNYVERTIEDFLFYANRHGGYIQKKNL